MSTTVNAHRAAMRRNSMSGPPIRPPNTISANVGGKQYVAMRGKHAPTKGGNHPRVTPYGKSIGKGKEIITKRVKKVKKNKKLQDSVDAVNAFSNPALKSMATTTGNERVKGDTYLKLRKRIHALTYEMVFKANLIARSDLRRTIFQKDMEHSRELMKKVHTTIYG